jgi:glutathione S-transferase
MIKLCGFALSNYYNKVKLALLEKGVPFTEEMVKVGPWAVPGLNERTPLGKVPFIETLHGNLCESQVIMDYIEQQWPTPALIPVDPWAAAKQREIVTLIELHLEMVARELYPATFFGGTVSDSNKDRIRKLLQKNIEGFKRLVHHLPTEGRYFGGEQFTQADCAAFVHLPLVGITSKIAYGSDMLEELGLPWKSYIKHVGQRASAQRVDADRKTYQESLAPKTS